MNELLIHIIVSRMYKCRSKACCSTVIIQRSSFGRFGKVWYRPVVASAVFCLFLERRWADGRACKLPLPIMVNPPGFLESLAYSDRERAPGSPYCNVDPIVDVILLVECESQTSASGGQ